MNSTLHTIIVVVFTLGMVSLTRNNKLKGWLISKLENSISSLQKYPAVSANFKLVDSPSFTQQQSLKDIAASLNHLSEFRARALRQNGVIYQRTGAVSPSDISQLEKIGYFDKLVAVNMAVDTNYDTLSKIIEYTLAQLISNNAFDSSIEAVLKDAGYTWDQSTRTLTATQVTLSQFSKTNSQSRVIEAMNHIVRDWSPDYDLERAPLLKYFDTALANTKVDKDTLIVVPGAGAGRVAYEIAKKFPHASVASIELSSLMYLCNEFVLGSKDEISIAPFCQCFSGQKTGDLQTRTYKMKLNRFTRPENLTVHFGDFCHYTPDRKYNNVIICSAFFIDTAANMFDYLAAMESFSNYCTGRLHWINVGPLKYGTRPLVQFTYEELTQLRKLRGWKDHASEIDVKNLNGYLTDYESTYQGFYGLIKFHSELQR